MNGTRHDAPMMKRRTMKKNEQPDFLPGLPDKAWLVHQMSGGHRRIRVQRNTSALNYFLKIISIVSKSILALVLGIDPFFVAETRVGASAIRNNQL
jgi:hypothetical protein